MVSEHLLLVISIFVYTRPTYFFNDTVVWTRRKRLLLRLCTLILSDDKMVILALQSAPPGSISPETTERTMLLVQKRHMIYSRASWAPQLYLISHAWIIAAASWAVTSTKIILGAGMSSSLVGSLLVWQQGVHLQTTAAVLNQFPFCATLGLVLSILL